MENLTLSLVSLEDDDQLRKWSAELRQSAALRHTWSQNAHLWRTLVSHIQVTSDHKPLSVPFLQFLNNITAASGAGMCSSRASFPSEFAQANVGSGTAGQRLYWQVLANLVSSYDQEDVNSLESLVDQLLSELPLLDGITTDVNEISYPCLIFVMIAHGRVLSQAIRYDIIVRSGFLNALLDALPFWLEGGNEKDKHISAAKEILQACVSNGTIGTIIQHYHKDALRQLSLLTMLDAIINSPSFIELSQFMRQASGRLCMEAIVSSLESYIEIVSGLIPSQNRTRDESFAAGQLTVKLLNILVTLLSSVRIGERAEQRRLVPKLIGLLVESKKIPPISKLGDMKSLEELPLDDCSLPHLRTYLLMLIAVLVEGDWNTQELVRTSGGLAAVLECCVIDGNNPFMKERAIVCLRFLLDQNDENQNFVASLEAKQVADPGALAESGYEATITNGQLTLKQSKS